MPVSTLLATALVTALIGAADAPATPSAVPNQAPANPSEDGPPPAALFTTAPPQPGALARYDAAVRASAAAADSLMGSLDGGWRLTDRRERPLYRIEIADRGLGPPTVEGSWRDLRRRRAGSCCGYLAVIVHQDRRLKLRFQAPGAKGETAVTLRPAGAGWTGELRRGGRATRVTLTRVAA